MSGLLVVGVSHRTSKVELRERLAAGDADLPDTARALATTLEVPEILLLSTCNRVEIYAHTDAAERTASRTRAWLDARAGESVGDALYVHHGAEAVRHIFRVTASLDSMVVGEPQILGQVKEAVAAARAGKLIGPMLDRCVSHALSVAKRVRSETKIAEGSVSVSSIAADLARKIFGDLDDREVLLVGAGEMGEAAARHLRGAGANLSVVNRSLENAEALAAQHGGRARGLEHLATELTRADVAIASTASSRFVLTPELLRGVIKARRHRPLFLIDIAVPRDVDPRVGEMDNVFLYDVDDLQQLADQNMRARQREAEAAARLVDAEVEAFERWRRSGSLKPTLIGLRERVRAVLTEEVARTAPRLKSLDDSDQRSLEKMVDAMTNKLLHRAFTELKATAESPEGEALAAAARTLFDLAPERAAEAAEDDPDEVPARGRRPATQG